MKLLDVNVVLAAHRDDHPQFGLVRPWFEEMLGRNEAFTVPTPVWGSFLRLATNRRIFGVPTPVADAFAFVRAVVDHPHHLMTTPGPRHLSILEDVCRSAAAVGDLVPDAMIVALAVEHAAVVVTMDRDFARFTSAPHELLVD